MSTTYPRIAALRSIAALRTRLNELDLDLPADDAALAAPASPLAEPLSLNLPAGAVFELANRFVIQPMEGWDGDADGKPTELTVRRWRNFGSSGAAWIWGGEAAAVRADGRANPQQLMIDDRTASALGALRRELVDAAGATATPLIGLQLTHSGRWARVAAPPVANSSGDAAPRFASSPAPRIAFRHPFLDRRTAIDNDAVVLDDDDVRDLIRRYARAAYLAHEEGYDFVDIKHCHGYLLHEFLAARSRPGAFGGRTLEERTRLTGELIAAVRQAAPRLAIGVRLSVFDARPHHPDGRDAAGHLGPGVPDEGPSPYTFGFGVDPHAPDRIDLEEPLAFVRLLRDHGVTWLNITAGSPYYVPHIQRPALFPPSDGYAPPEDPLVGVVRLLHAARDVKAAVPEMTVVSSGWSYLQEYIPHVAQACLRAGWCDAIGLGRLVLSYPDLPADVLAGHPLARKRLCRTFSDCTTAPRHGLVSGCYPLDPFYKSRPEATLLRMIKAP